MTPIIAFVNPSPPRFGRLATLEADTVFVNFARQIPQPLDRRFDEVDYSDVLRAAESWLDEPKGGM